MLGVAIDCDQIQIYSYWCMPYWLLLIDFLDDWNILLQYYFFLNFLHIKRSIFLLLFDRDY